MIIQLLLDFISQVGAKALSILPDAPANFDRVGQSIEDTGYMLADLASKLNVIFPFEVFGIIVPMWISLMGFFVAVIGVRIILWIVNR